MRIRSALAIALGLALLLAAAYALAAVVVWSRLTGVTGDCPAGFAGNDPTAFDLPEAYGLDPAAYAMPGPDEVAIPSREDGITVSAWFIRAESSANRPEPPAVIVVHGHNGCKRSDDVLLAAGMLYRNGFSVLLVDLRDHGDSTLEDGRYAGGTEEYLEVLGAWDWLRTGRGLPAERIGLLGVSLGAATVLIAAGEEPAVAAVWADSSYADVRVAIRAELQRNGYPTFLEWGGVALVALVSGDDLGVLGPQRAVERLGGRALFITHGVEDSRLSVSYADDLALAARQVGARVETWIVPGAEHTEAMYLVADEYERRLVAFFSAALGRAVTTP